MGRVKIVITTGNAAFDDEPASEIARILRTLAERFEHDGIPPEAIRDANGNVCGSVEVNARLHAFTAESCPSKHHNDGTDHCADCGAFLG